MCGIAGVVTNGKGDLDPIVAIRMCERLSHRGPDSHGIVLGGPSRFRPDHFEPDGAYTMAVTRASRPFALASTRLSIIDLSDAGRQPMCSDDGMVWIVFNGEVYDHPQHRTWLESRGHRFRSRSDTEVVLRLYEEFGDEAFARLNGMFGLAIWDGHSESLVLARDRFGIKPLYYAEVPEGFAFASELKALLPAGLKPTLDIEALHRYLTFLWVPEPDTIVRGVRKLEPGCSLRVDARTGVAVERRYWTQTIQTGGPEMSEQAAGEEVLDRLMTAVSRQTISDVPVGAFLSGGLDSSAIVTLMVQTGHPPSCVHSVGFSAKDQAYERGGDDLWYARTLAKALGLPHQEIVLEPDIADLLPRLVWHLDEPLADPAIIPTYLICDAARSRTKVLLSGMGADELFGGYRRHLVPLMSAVQARIPRPVRRGMRAAIDRLPATGTSRLVAVARRAKKLVRAFDESQEDQYIQSCTWIEPHVRDGLYTSDVRAAINGSRADARHRAIWSEIHGIDCVNRSLYLDTRTYLPSHNLNYTDKMSMAASVEVRVPFLDNDLVDLAFRLPSAFKVRGLTGKYILKKALEPLLPRLILSRPKTGFAAPIRSWLMGDLREMVGDLLSPSRVASRGLLKPQAVSALVKQPASDREDRSYQVWALLTLELWMQAYLDHRA